MNYNVIIREAKDWTISIAIAVVLALVIRYFIVELYLVDGSSMKPTLFDGQRLVVNKFIYRWLKDPQHGDIVVFKYPSDQNRDFIKRVIATPGDTIEIIDGTVFLNGNQIHESYIYESMRIANNYPKIEIPKDYVFVMGDNRNNSEDSRFSDVGLVSYDLIKGKAVLIFWPLNKIKTLP
ncbi:MAG: signal peptidase I [Negativicutes bacterium]|jgi:signal peptidase I